MIPLVILHPFRPISSTPAVLLQAPRVGLKSASINLPGSAGTVRRELFSCPLTVASGAVRKEQANTCSAVNMHLSFVCRIIIPLPHSLYGSNWRLSLRNGISFIFYKFKLSKALCYLVTSKVKKKMALEYPASQENWRNKWNLFKCIFCSLKKLTKLSSITIAKETETVYRQQQNKLLQSCGY